MSENVKENKMGIMPIPKLLFTMSLPLILSMLVQALYNIVDSIFVAQINESALTAVSLAFPIQNLMISVASGTGVDYDLTQMNGDMVYATVYQMMADPSTYEGKTFRMEGLYTPIIVEDTGKIYHYCLIQDALACCAQGMEFVSGDGSHTDQSEYPPEDTDIIVEGIFETYREEDDENLYCRLANATMEVVQ